MTSQEGKAAEHDRGLRDRIHRLFSIDERVALVTGGTSGIGRLIALAFASAGARVYISGRDAERSAQAAKEISEESQGLCRAIAGDISNRDGICGLAHEFGECEKTLHVLVNNAGRESVRAIDEFTEEDWDSVLDLNLKTPFFLVQKMLGFLKAGATPEHPAAIINIGSVGGLRIGPRENYSYAASKAALHHLTGSLAKRLGPEHITVNAIAPGFFETGLTRNTTDQALQQIVENTPRRRIGRFDDVGGLSIFLSSQAASFITGAVVPLAGGMTL